MWGLGAHLGPDGGGGGGGGEGPGLADHGEGGAHHEGGDGQERLHHPAAGAQGAGGAEERVVVPVVQELGILWRSWWIYASARRSRCRG